MLRSWPVSLALLGAPAALGCGLPDLFAPAGLADVSFTFVGDSTIRVGDRIPFAIIVEAGGSELLDVQLRTLLNGNEAVALTESGDSLVGVQVGRGELHVWLVSSLVTDSEPSFIQTIKVQGGGGGGGGGGG